MSKYRSRQSSGTLSAAPQAVTRHAPATPLKSSKFRKLSSSKAVSRFQLDNHIVDELLDSVNASRHQGTVQEEFDKYTAASLSLLETDILQFWEVSYTHTVTRINDADLNNTDQQGGVSDIVWNCPGLSSDPGIFRSL